MGGRGSEAATRKRGTQGPVKDSRVGQGVGGRGTVGALLRQIRGGKLWQGMWGTPAACTCSVCAEGTLVCGQTVELWLGMIDVTVDSHVCVTARMHRCVGV